jgi:hypothetical protein
MGNFAQQIPQQRLMAAQNLAQVNQGLATQAMQNRAALVSMGSQLRGAEQGFRARTSQNEQVTSSPGGFMGAVQGGLAGVGTGASLYSMFGGPSKPAPVQQTTAAGGSYYSF